MYHRDSVDLAAYAARVKAVRKSLGLTMKEFGEKIGFDTPTVCRIEKGKTFSLKGVIGTRKLANCTLDWLILGIGEPPTGVQLEIPHEPENPS